MWFHVADNVYLVSSDCISTSPYVCDAILVVVVCRPYRYLVSFSSDVNNSTTHIVAMVVECFTYKTQELQHTPITIVSTQRVLVLGWVGVGRLCFNDRVVW